MQQNDVVTETDVLPAEKRPRTEDLLLDESEGYEPDSPHCRQASMSFGWASRMRLPDATMNAYFMTNEYLVIKEKYTTEHIRKGWELFRRLGYCEALASYTIKELQEGLEYITDGILPFYERIHRDEIERHNRRHATDSGYFSRPVSLQNTRSSVSLPRDRLSTTFVDRESLYSEATRSQPPSTLLQHGSISSAECASQIYAINKQAAPTLNNDGRHTSIVSNIDGNSQRLSLNIYGHAQDQNQWSSSSVPSPALSGRLDGSDDMIIRGYTSKKSRKEEDLFKNKYQCTYCEKRFANEANRENHEKDQHDSQFTYICPHTECEGREFSSKQGFDTHHRKAHDKCVGRKDCLSPQYTLKRQSKRAAACGVCGMLFRDSKTILKDRADHIHRHYSHTEDPKYLYHWRETRWKKTPIAFAFLRTPEVIEIWLNYKLKRFEEAEVLNNWENVDDQAWSKFVELAEFGDFSAEHAKAIVEMAYELVDKRPRSATKQAKFSNPVLSNSKTPTSASSLAISSITYRSAHGAPGNFQKSDADMISVPAESPDASHLIEEHTQLRPMNNLMMDIGESTLSSNPIIDLGSSNAIPNYHSHTGNLSSFVLESQQTTAIPIRADFCMTTRSTNNIISNSPTLAVDSHSVFIPWSSPSTIAGDSLMSNLTVNDPHQSTNVTYLSSGTPLLEPQTFSSLLDIEAQEISANLLEESWDEL